MPPKKILSAYIFVIDLHIKSIIEVRKKFYKILLKYAQDKADTKSQDVYKIILVGSNKTDNVNDYKNINIFSDWSIFKQEDIFELIPKLEATSIGKRGNLFEGIDLAVEHIQNDMLVTHYKPKNVIVISDLLFESPNVNKNSLRHALSGVWLYVLGADVKIPKLENIRDIKCWVKKVEPANNDINLRKNLKIVEDIKENGLVADLNIGWQLLFTYVAQTKPPYPWYCDMTIGDIIIKINVIKLIDESHQYKFPKSKSGKETGFEYDESVRNQSILPKSDSGFETGFEFDEQSEQSTSGMVNPDTGEIVSNPVAAYKVKGRFAVLTEEQEQELAREENEDKCFELKYFVDASVATPDNFVRNQLHAVIPDIRGSEDWHKPLKVLAEAMFEENVAAVIKRIYAKGPQFREMPYLLFNCPDHGTDCLLLAKLPFAHEVSWKEPTFEKKDPEQNSLVKSEVKTNLYKYLSDLTVRDDDNLYQVREYFLQNPNYSSQYDHIINSLIDTEYNIYERNIPEYTMNKILEKRCENSWKNLEPLLPVCEEEKP